MLHFVTRLDSIVSGCGKIEVVNTFFLIIFIYILHLFFKYLKCYSWTYLGAGYNYHTHAHTYARMHTDRQTDRQTHTHTEVTKKQNKHSKEISSYSWPVYLMNRNNQTNDM